VKTEFHPEAYEDMRESARYYEERSPGLGKDFLAAVRETTRQIKRSGRRKREKVPGEKVSGTFSRGCQDRILPLFPLERKGT
jgi:hypothetical protein